MNDGRAEGGADCDSVDGFTGAAAFRRSISACIFSILESINSLKSRVHQRRSCEGSSRKETHFMVLRSVMSSPTTSP